MMTLNKPPNLVFTLEPKALKLWTVENYHRMGEFWVIRPDERTELIGGQVLLMPPRGAPHVGALLLLVLALNAQLVNQPFFVSTQDPIQLDDFSEPEPDCAIVRDTTLDYGDRHPDSTDIALVVEVADSTLKYDVEVKDKLYAQSGITDYWVVDLKNRQLHVFRNPTATGYTSHLILTEPNQITPIAFPQITLALTDILPPAT
jgi:Uma2 family endonuclease